MDSRIADLEIRLTYQESTIDALNDVVVKQQNQIDLLKVEVESLRGQLTDGGGNVRPLSEETPPPHY